MTPHHTRTDAAVRSLCHCRSSAPEFCCCRLHHRLSIAPGVRYHSDKSSTVPSASHSALVAPAPLYSVGLSRGKQHRPELNLKSQSGVRGGSRCFVHVRRSRVEGVAVQMCAIRAVAELVLVSSKIPRLYQELLSMTVALK